jgi:hypothetical protein
MGSVLDLRTLDAGEVRHALHAQGEAIASAL